MSSLVLEWAVREPPLPPCAVVAEGPAAVALARAALARTDEALGALEGVAGPGVLALLGEAAQLPWCDGAVYYGRAQPHARLLVPVLLEASVPTVLLERALVKQGAALPAALLVASSRLVSLSDARRVDRRQLEAWAQEAVA